MLVAIFCIKIIVKKKKWQIFNWLWTNSLIKRIFRIVLVRFWGACSYPLSRSTLTLLCNNCFFIARYWICYFNLIFQVLTHIIWSFSINSKCKLPVFKNDFVFSIWIWSLKLQGPPCSLYKCFLWMIFLRWRSSDPPQTDSWHLTILLPQPRSTKMM